MRYTKSTILYVAWWTFLFLVALCQGFDRSKPTTSDFVLLGGVCVSIAVVESVQWWRRRIGRQKRERVRREAATSEDR